jgi:hypothetical protein
VSAADDRVKHPVKQPPAVERFHLVRCAGCRSPLGKVACGARFEFKCKHCGAVTSVQA